MQFLAARGKRSAGVSGQTRSCAASTATAEQGDEMPMMASEELLNALMHDPSAAMQPLLDAKLVNLEARTAVGMEGDIVSKIRCEVFNQVRKRPRTLLSGDFWIQQTMSHAGDRCKIS